MKAIYVDSSVPEKEAKKRFGFPEFVMMENAAIALEQAVCEYASASRRDLSSLSVLILCGTGNNGGDGFALARRLNCLVEKVTVVSFGPSKTDESLSQRKMAESTGLFFLSPVVDKSILLSDVIVDCVYGTGFHGILPPEVCDIFEWANSTDSFRIACDIPSGIDKNGLIATEFNFQNKSSVNFLKKNEKIVGPSQLLAFCAHKTVTMGALKTSLFSDESRDFCGKIVRGNLGISPFLFESCAIPDGFLLEDDDTKYPERTKKSAHKGNFGHVAVVLGEKAGAGIIAGTAALKFGAGLVTVVKSVVQSQPFVMSPELMISESFPQNTTAVLLGSGLGRANESQRENRIIEDAVQDSFFCVESMEKPAVVLDADFFYFDGLTSVLERLNKTKNARVILTPHPKEFAQLIKITMPELLEKCKTNAGEKEVILKRFEYGKMFSRKYQNLTLIAKGAVTYIFSDGKAYFCDSGSNALAKAGSGDVLAGMCTSLLAQGYSATDAAITAVYTHGKAGSSFQNNWECTPLALVEKI